MSEAVRDDGFVHGGAALGENEIDGACIFFRHASVDEAFVNEAGYLTAGGGGIHRTRLRDLAERDGALIGEAAHDRIAGAGDNGADRSGLSGVEATVGSEAEQALEGSFEGDVLHRRLRWCLPRFMFV